MPINPMPQEMSDAALEKLFPDQNALVKRMPLDDAADLLGIVNDAMVAENAKPASTYNPDHLNVYNFRWAYLQYYKTNHLVAESIQTTRVHAGDEKLIPLNGCQTYMVELTNLNRPA